MSKEPYKNFCFELANSKPARTSRKIHIRRLYDVLELCIHRGDLQRARNAWAILLRCEEVDWLSLWRIGALLAGSGPVPAGRSIGDRLEYLKTIMLQCAESVCDYLECYVRPVLIISAA